MSNDTTNTQTANSQPDNESALDRAKRMALELFNEPVNTRIPPRVKWAKAWRKARRAHGMGKRDWDNQIEVAAFTQYARRHVEFMTAPELLDSLRADQTSHEAECEHYRQLDGQDAMKDDDGNWEDLPMAYALVKDGSFRIIDVDDVMDDTTVVMVGSLNQCDKCLTQMIAASYEARVARFEAAYEAHIEEMACGY